MIVFKKILRGNKMKKSYKSSLLIALAMVMVSGGSVLAVNALDFSSKASIWADSSCNEKQLNQKKPDMTDALCDNVQQVEDNSANLAEKQNQINSLSEQVTEQESQISLLSEKVAGLQQIPSEDFSFFTNYGIKYGSYHSSPVYDAGKYSKYSMTFTCTTNNNDKVKYWIETSTDAVNWSPTGYYEVNCNGSYGGASLNQGQTSARYYQVVSQQMTVNNRTNTINSFARFSN